MSSIEKTRFIKTSSFGDSTAYSVIEEGEEVVSMHCVSFPTEEEILGQDVFINMAFNSPACPSNYSGMTVRETEIYMSQWKFPKAVSGLVKQGAIIKSINDKLFQNNLDAVEYADTLPNKEVKINFIEKNIIAALPTKFISLTKPTCDNILLSEECSLLSPITK